MELDEKYIARVFCDKIPWDKTQAQNNRSHME
jgi:hypothetical protein